MLTLGVDSGINFEYGLETEDVDTFCMAEMPGLTFLIHPPDEVPDISKRATDIQVNQNAKILLKPRMTKISDGLELLLPEKYRNWEN